MKRWIILTTIILLVLLLIRLGFKISKGHDEMMEERKWYAQQLRYDFSATIDTVIWNKEKDRFGIVLSHITRGILNTNVEDSLQSHLKTHKLVRLNLSNTLNEFKIVLVPPLSADTYLPGDSIVVISASDQIRFFRDGKKITDRTISEVLEARKFTTINLDEVW